MHEDSVVEGIFMAQRNAACAIMIAYSGKRAFYLTLNRDPRGKWASAIMLGPAETREHADSGRIVPTLIRGLKEELSLSRPNILSISPYQLNVEPGIDFVMPDGSAARGRNISEAYKYAAHFFLVEVSLPTLRRIKGEINAGKHEELRSAQIHRGLPALLRATLTHSSNPYLQPHARLIFERMKRNLEARYPKKARLSYGKPPLIRPVQHLKPRKKPL